MASATMKSGSSSKAVVATLRGILRHVMKRPSVTGIQHEWPQQILSQYRENKSLKDKKEIRRRRSVAKDYLELLESVKLQQELQWLDAGAEVRLSVSDLVKASAHRVGLTVPGVEGGMPSSLGALSSSGAEANSTEPASRHAGKDYQPLNDVHLDNLLNAAAGGGGITKEQMQMLADHPLLKGKAGTIEEGDEETSDSSEEHVGREGNASGGVGAQ